MFNFLALPYRKRKTQHRDYTADDIKAMRGEDEAKVNFAYDTGITRMQEIETDVKIINARATLLLGYLATIVAGLLFFLFKESTNEVAENTEYLTEILFGQNAKDLAEILLIIYLINIFLVAITLINPTLAFHAHNEPECIMVEKEPLKVIKIFEINGLQSDIESNMKRLYTLTSWLRGCIFLAFLAPFIAFAWASFA